ncbi:hypothetical protein PSP31120_00652 [Pandoraea sputorum]|nr:hypothetical protein PSP31120_00652 [Pandoraea sputorum]
MSARWEGMAADCAGKTWLVVLFHKMLRYQLT